MTTPVQLTPGSQGSLPQPQGLTVKISTDMGRIQVTCPHQSGLIYVVPARPQLGVHR